MMGLPMGGWGRASNQPTMANRGAIGERGGGLEERGRMESEAAEKERRRMGGGGGKEGHM